ncbi:MAG: MFS transporter [Bacillota bacterium]|nr:MFS transporter [Bacillota bacterium]
MSGKRDSSQVPVPRSPRPSEAGLIVGLGLIPFLYFAAFTLTISFLTMFLSLEGYSERTIGLYMALSSLAVLLIQFVWGRIADRWDCDALLISILVGCSIFWPLLLYRFRARPGMVLVILLLLSFTLRSLVPSNDAYITKQLERFGSSSYGYIRALGSIGAALAALLGGWLAEHHGFQRVFELSSLLLLVLLLVIQLGWRRLGRYPGRVKTPARGGQRLRADRQFGFVEGIPRGLLPVSLIAMLVTIGAGIHYTYVPVLYLQLGGDLTSYGVVNAAMAASEVFGMIGYTRLRRRFSLLQLFLFSQSMYLLKLLLIAQASDYRLIIPAQLLQAVTFAIHFPTLVDYLTQISRVEERATVMTLSTVIHTGCGLLIGNLCGSLISGMYSIQAAYRFGAVMVGLSLLLMALVMPRYFRAAGTADVSRE